jgi:hypothetical protein
MGKAERKDMIDLPQIKKNELDAETCAGIQNDIKGLMRCKNVLAEQLGLN